MANDFEQVYICWYFLRFGSWYNFAYVRSGVCRCMSLLTCINSTVITCSVNVQFDYIFLFNIRVHCSGNSHTL